MTERLKEGSINRRELLGLAAGVAIRPVFSAEGRSEHTMDTSASTIFKNDKVEVQPLDEAIRDSQRIIDKIKATLINSKVEFKEKDHVKFASKHYTSEQGLSLRLSQETFDFGKYGGLLSTARVILLPESQQRGIEIDLYEDRLPQISFSGYFGVSDPMEWLSYGMKIDEKLSELHFNDLELEKVESLVDNIAQNSEGSHDFTKINDMLRVEELAAIRSLGFQSVDGIIDFKNGIGLLHRVANFFKNAEYGINVVNLVSDIMLLPPTDAEQVEIDSEFFREDSLLEFISQQLSDTVGEQITIGDEVFTAGVNETNEFLETVDKE